MSIIGAFPGPQHVGAADNPENLGSSSDSGWHERAYGGITGTFPRRLTREERQMTSTHVTLQVDVAHDPAGDWAVRQATSRHSTRTLRSLGLTNDDDTTVRLNAVRGMIEALRRGPRSEHPAATRSSADSMGFGSPIAYRGIRFIVPVWE